MATKTIPKTSDRKPQEAALAGQQLHDKLQRIIDSQDQKLIKATNFTLDSFIWHLQKPKKGGAA